MTVRYIGKSRSILVLAVPLTVLAILAPGAGRAAEGDGLWPVYEQSLKGAKYVDLTHTITPKIPVWAGFGASTFAPAKAGADIEGFVKTGEVYTYDKHGFEATEYALKTDQLGTQLNPPTHWRRSPLSKHLEATTISDCTSAMRLMRPLRTVGVSNSSRCRSSPSTCYSGAPVQKFGTRETLVAKANWSSNKIKECSAFSGAQTRRKSREVGTDCGRSL